MRSAKRFTRPAHLLGAVGFTLLLAACSEQPTAPSVVTLAPATVGSIVKSNVVTTTTVCLKLDECKSNTRSSEIREKVADPRSTQLRAALAMVGDDNSKPSADQWSSLGQISNVHISGRKLALDIARNGKVWHLEMTHDAVAKEKISAAQLSLNGELLISKNAKWTPVSGVWYHQHTDMSVFHAGHLAGRSEKTFTPEAVLPPDASDHSTASLTLSSTATYRLSSVCGTAIIPDGSDCTDGGGCPPEFEPICEWFQAGNNPVPILNSVVGTLGDVVQGVSNWLAGVQAANEDLDAVWNSAETVLAWMQAFADPNAFTISIAIDQSLANTPSSTLLEAIGDEMLEWLAEIGVLFF